MEAWNHFAEGTGLATIRAVTPKRAKSIQARAQDGTLGELLSIFREIRQSSFARGQNNQGWKIDFDWIFSSPNNAAKLLEGKYRDKGQGQAKQATKPEPAEWVQSRY